MKKFAAIVLSLAMVCSLLLVGCGSNEYEKQAGKYHVVVCEAYGIQMTAKEASMDSFIIELKANGKFDAEISGTSDSGKFTIEGDKLSMKIEGEEIVGTMGEDMFTVDDFLGYGLKVIFAKEGSKADDASLYKSDDTIDYSSIEE